MSDTTAVHQMAWSGGRLRELREAKGWTQSRLRDEMLAAGAGPSHPNQVAGWEAGSPPGSKFLTVLCALFDVAPSHFYQSEQ